MRVKLICCRRSCEVWEIDMESTMSLFSAGLTIQAFTGFQPHYTLGGMVFEAPTTGVSVLTKMTAFDWSIVSHKGQRPNTSYARTFFPTSGLPCIAPALEVTLSVQSGCRVCRAICGMPLAVRLVYSTPQCLDRGLNFSRVG